MARSCKSMGETTGSNRLCLRCHHCKCRSFRTEDALVYWSAERGIGVHSSWLKKLEGAGEVRLYWCSSAVARAKCLRPRMFRLVDNPFIRNCLDFKE